MKHPAFTLRRAAALPALLAGLGAAACSQSGSGSGSALSFSLSTRQAPAAPLASAPVASLQSPQVVVGTDSTVITLGQDTVILRSVEMVLRKIELKRVETAACDSIEGNSDCEEFESGPVLVSLPLGVTNTETAVSINAPAGQYDKLEFEIHAAHQPDDAAFLAANPGFDGISIKATGTYSHAGARSDFTYTTDLDESQESVINPPLDVVDGTPANVTLRVDISGWFVNGARDGLVDPASANIGQPNEGIVKDNIKQSIEGLKDDNHDGLDDDHEE